MLNILKFTLIACGVCLALGLTMVQASDKIQIDKVTASAGITSNLWNSENSIKFKSKQLLAKALARAGDSNNAVVVFTSVPTTFLEGKTDSAGIACETRLAETTKTPIIFSNRIFANDSALLDWISDFSQGDGKEGNDLYKRCSGDCSPQYEYHISKTEEGSYNLTARVICGKARNKSDDLYYLTTYMLQ
jgi:hypothetical protein